MGTEVWVTIMVAAWVASLAIAGAAARWLAPRPRRGARRIRDRVASWVRQFHPVQHAAVAAAQPAPPAGAEPREDPWAEGVRDIQERLVEQRHVLVTGPGSRAVLERLTTTSLPKHIQASTEVIDLYANRFLDGADLLEQITDSLERRGVPPFSEFHRRLATYRSSRTGQRTGLDRAASAAQTGAAAASSMIPVVGTATSTLLGSPSVTDLIGRGVAAIQGSGSLAEVRNAFVEDFEQVARGERILLVLADVDASSDGPQAVGVIFEAISRLRDSAAMVASAANTAAESDRSFKDAARVVLARMPDDVVRRQLQTAELDEEAIRDLVQTVGGLPDRLENVLAFQRVTTLKPTEANQRELYLAQAKAWAAKAAVFRALDVVDEGLRPLVLCLSLLRWFNMPIVDVLIGTTHVAAKGSDVANLWHPKARPYWIAGGPFGWQFADEQLRLSMQEEVRRSDPALVAQTHRCVADFHRREMWRRVKPATVVDDDVLSLPERGRFQERWDGLTLAHESEWCHHMLQLDPRGAFEPVVRRIIEALYHDESSRVMELLESRQGADLSPRQSYLLDLMRRSAAAQQARRPDAFRRYADQLVSMTRQGGIERTLLEYMIGVSLMNLGRPRRARGRFIDVLKLIPEQPSGTARQVRSLAEATVGLIDVEAEAVFSGNERMQGALKEARRLDDKRLIAEIHRLRVRGVLTSYAGQPVDSAGEQTVKDALEEIDLAVAPGIAAAVKSQLATVFTSRLPAVTDEVVQEAEQPDRLLQQSLEMYRALQDRDGEIDMLCQRAPLARYLGHPEEALERRREALSRSEQPAATHFLMTEYETDASRLVLEMRSACTVEALSLLDGQKVLAPDAEPLPARSDLLTLIALYSSELGDYAARESYAGKAKAAWGGDAELDPGILDRIDELTAADTSAIARVERQVIHFPDGSPTYRYRLGLFLLWLDREGPRDGSEAVLGALWAGIEGSLDEPDQVRDLDDALRRYRDDPGRDRLIRRLEEQTRLEPSEAGYPASLAACLSSVGDRNEECVAMARLAHEREPETLTYVTVLAASLADAGSPLQAVDLLREKGGSATMGGTLEPVVLNVAVEVVYKAASAGMPWEDLEQVLSAAASLAASGANLKLRRAIAATYQREVTSRVRDSVHPDSEDHPRMPSPDHAERRVITRDLLNHALAVALPGEELAGAGVVPEPADMLDAIELLIEARGFLPTGSPSPEALIHLLESQNPAPEDQERLADCIMRLSARGRSAAAGEWATSVAAERSRMLAEAAGRRAVNGYLSEDVGRPIRVLIGYEIVQHVDPNQSDDARLLYDDHHGMLLELREWLSHEWGFRLPGVNVSKSDAGPRRFDLVIRGITVARLVLGSAWATPLEHSDVRRLTDADAKGTTPVGTSLLTWISEQQHLLLERLAEPTLDLRGVLCVILAELLPAHAQEILDAESAIELAVPEAPTEAFLRDDFSTVYRGLRAQLQSRRRADPAGLSTGGSS